jgi:ankyrin repeat protein
MLHTYVSAHLPISDRSVLPYLHTRAHRAQAGRTGLLYAAQYGHLGIVQYLLDKGADIALADSVPHAPLAPAQ